MPAQTITSRAKQFAGDGFLSPVELFSAQEARAHRQRLEAIERAAGPMHYKTKVHTILTSPYELACDPRVLDVVEELLGRDILLYNVTYIVKEAHSDSHVSWHQDLTYWGFDGDAQVSMWLALSPATRNSGCMRMVPGSHTAGRRQHHVTEDATNVLYQGQTVEGVAEEQAVLCPLQPGQASFHHGWTLHASLPNTSGDRRIGLNVQYLAPSMRQIKHPYASAMLVRGEDRFGYYDADTAPSGDLQPQALARQRELEAIYQATAGTS